MFLTASKKVCLAAATFALTACSSTQAETDIIAEIWADNWFTLYLNEAIAAEDPVVFNTERSFNAETFAQSVELPAQAAMIMKDFYENDSGLEYIGGRRQQMGDGGLRAQFRDAETGNLIAVSNDEWMCKVIHQAPLNQDCVRSDDPINECQAAISEEPAGWTAADFDDSDWTPAIIHSAQDMRPHGGYTDIAWESESQLIWSEDLEVDNVILCRFTIDAPAS